MYLTQEHIDFLLRQARDPVWRMGVFSKFPNSWYDIMALSPAKLIYFKGNSETGFTHIQERHGFYSEKNYFGQGALRDPSKFSSKSLPLFDYLNVADDVYLMQTKDEKQHPEGHLFDKYIGESARYTGSDGTKKKFFLVLYKNTRIVHSIYPETHLVEKPLKRKLKEFARAKTEIMAYKKLAGDYWTLEVPYEDERHIIRYVIIFYYNEISKIARGYIQVNTWKGDPWFSYVQILCEFPLNMPLPSLYSGGPGDDLEFTRFLNGLAHQYDFSKIEVYFPRIEEELTAMAEKQQHSQDDVADNGK